MAEDLVLGDLDDVGPGRGEGLLRRVGGGFGWRMRRRRRYRGVNSISHWYRIELEWRGSELGRIAVIWLEMIFRFYLRASASASATDSRNRVRMRGE